MLNEATAAAKLTLANGIDLNGATRTVAVNANTAEISGVIRTSSGTAGLTKIGSGTLVLTNANTYTGPTTVSGGTLTLNSRAGSLSSSSGLTFANTGTFNMDNTGATTALSKNMGALAFSAGDGTVKETRTAAYDQQLTFASLAARTIGATGNFALSSGTPGAANGFVLTGQGAGFIDQGIFWAGGSTAATYAWMDGAGTFVRAVNYGTDSSTATIAGGTALPTGFSHVQTTGAITAQGSDTFTSLRIQNTANSAQAFTLASGATLTVNGILRAGNGGASSTTTISGGTAIQAANNAELVIRTDMANDLLVISTPIVANGVNALTKSGAGTLTLSGTNSYTGGTTLNAGLLRPANNSALSTGTLTINGGQLDLGNNNSTSIALPNNTIVLNGSCTIGSGLRYGNTGAGQLRLSGAGYTITTGSNNDGGGAAGTWGNVFGNTFTDASGGNTLNAFDVAYSVTSTTAAATLTGSITLRGNQTLNATCASAAGLFFNGSILEGTTPGYSLTINGSINAPGGVPGRGGSGVVFAGANTYTGVTAQNV